jgi:hypothetical protein
MFCALARVACRFPARFLWEEFFSLLILVAHRYSWPDGLCSLERLDRIHAFQLPAKASENGC